jgi:hypothetical protein
MSSPALAYAVLLLYPLGRIILRAVAPTIGNIGSDNNADYETGGASGKLLWLLYCTSIAGAVYAASLQSGLPLSRPNALNPGLSALIGAISGLVLASWAFPAIPNKRRTVSPANAVRSDYSTLFLTTLDACCDEFWRAFSLVALLNLGLGVPETVFFVTITFLIGRISPGGTISLITGSILGTVFLGGMMELLFLRSGSLVAPVTCRIIAALLQFVLYEKGLPRRTRWAPLLRCTHCQAWLIVESMTLREFFQCPQCETELCISRHYEFGAKMVTAAAAAVGSLLSGARGLTFVVLLVLFAFVLYSPISLLVVLILRPRLHDRTPDSLNLFGSRR